VFEVTHFEDEARRSCGDALKEVKKLKKQLAEARAQIHKFEKDIEFYCESGKLEIKRREKSEAKLDRMEKELAEARNSISTWEQVHLEDKQINALLKSDLNTEIERLLTNRTDLSNELIKCSIKLDRIQAAVEELFKEETIKKEEFSNVVNSRFRKLKEALAQAKGDGK
jgi:hypothetical protein